ncbi:acyl-CoA thioesterase [Segniliparus rugosus]|uniref:Acyl-CoA thioesterase II n=1 Tax=Segniliparus rugosus (strain ATCC BAA-974 / DSM 45345 / CCUG 50838 / CIP 108380 / JCM 13579 / CDC 945) TaxID=679197 RepID=E5XS47_SEGRC|nr:acyl-CoA thioesterase II [Segniliparus rugosus]EFV12832.1 acyl-CoA thioesterase II [Segniliparus rugosus ATCC BAA-974]
MTSAQSLIEEAKGDFQELLEILDLEDGGNGKFIGQHPSKAWARTYGGQIVAQTIIAAGRTVESDKLDLHVAQTHFIRGGDVKQPIEYQVTALRDERSIANRQVTASQNGEVMSVSLLAYQLGRPGLEHSSPMPSVPDPEGLPEIEETFVGMEKDLTMFVEAPRPIDWRYTNKPSWLAKEAGEAFPYNRVWMRTRGELPDEPRWHEAALAYASDTTILDSIITQHGLSWGLDRIIAATLNHSLWFHRPVRFDQWHLYATESPAAAESRGFSTGAFYARNGDRIASSAQEGMVIYRPRK